MKRFFIPIVILLAALIVTGGFFLPTIVSQVKDRQTVGLQSITDGSGISFETKSELKIVDRLKMLTNAGRVELDNGKNMNADTAYQSALAQLTKLSGMLLLNFDLSSCTLNKSGVSFFIDSSDPAKNLIVWDLFIQDATYDIMVAIDDETGKLLAMQVSLNELSFKKGMTITTRPAVSGAPSDGPLNIPEAVSAIDVKLIGQALADYYGLTYIGSAPMKSDKYNRTTFELSDGQESVTLTVTVTHLGFMFNV